MLDDIEQETGRGLALHQAGDYVAAEACYRNILAQQPDDAEAAHLLGLLLVQNGDSTNGVHLIEQAVAALPEVPLYRFNLATVQLEMGEYAQAVNNFEHCSEIAPGFAGISWGLGRAYAGLGRYGLAVEYLELATAFDARDDLAPLVLLGELHLRYCFYDKAIFVLERVRQSVPDDPAIICLLANAHDANGAIDPALDLCRQLAAIEPEQAWATLTAIAERHLENRRYDAVVLVRETMLALQPDNEANKLALAEVRELQKVIAESVGKIPLRNISLLFIEISKKCNYKCIFCGHPHIANGEKRQLRLDDVKKFAPLIEKVGAVDITGYGEITAHPDFDGLLDLFSACSVPVRFVTNGSLLTPERVAKIVSSSVDEVVVSLNALDDANYKYLSYGDAGADMDRISCRNVVDGIDRLLDARRHSGKSLRLYVTFVITSINFREMGAFVDFAAERGVPITFQGLVPRLNDIYPKGLHVPDTTENREYLQSVIAYAKTRGVSLCPFNFDTQRVADEPIDEAVLVAMVKSCDWVYSKSFIAMTGDVGPCCWSDGRSLGNVFEHSFEDIWNGELYEDLRARIRDGDTRYCRLCRRNG